MCYSPFKQYQKKAIGLENYLFHSLSTMEKSKVNRKYIWSLTTYPGCLNSWFGIMTKFQINCSSWSLGWQRYKGKIENI